MTTLKTLRSDPKPPGKLTLKETLQFLREFDGALLANTLDYIDPTPAHERYLAGSIQPMTPDFGPSVGLAFTCEMESSTPNQTAEMDGFWQLADTMKASGLPAIWVVKSVGPRPEHECLAGDGMGKLLFSSGCVGIVTDGRVRDLKGLAGIPLGVYAKGISIHHSAMRVTKINVPVEVGGVTIKPGDVLHASAEGVITIPTTSLERLPESAVRMWGFERDAHAVFSRIDLPSPEKKRQVTDLLRAYGFLHATPTKADEQGVN